MKTKILIAVIASMYLIPFYGYAQEKTVKTVFFEGGSCELFEFVKKPMFAPANMGEDEKAVILRLKCSLKQNVGTDNLKALYEKGALVTPDGQRYKAAVSILKNDNDGIIYSLVVAIPKTVDDTTLKFVYNNQVLILKE